ncbi:MAG: DUF2723 domain-containing protein [Candidatus Glassbacteria bacterium]|nr:DUF2723 domain-containing protein [Candidatus Glassbacteria bacterium]
MYKKEHWIGAAITFLFAFIGYLITMAPSVTFWDAGEFIAASYTLGIPHPPGTPLFVIIGRVLSAMPLPMGIAARLNFLSVLCGAAGALLIYLIAVRIIGTWVREPESLPGRVLIHGGAFASAIIPSFMRTTWSNATEFEVYAVSTATFLFCAWLMVYMGQSLDRQRMQRTLLLVVYIVSLSIANHMIVLLVTPGVIIYTLLHDRENWRYWLSIVGMFLGVYLLVMKGLDLGLVFRRLSEAGRGQEGLLVETMNHIGALLDILFGIGDYIGSSKAMFLGVLLSAGFGWWSYRQKSLGFFGMALGLFLLGFSLHLYLLIRANLDPSINEGDPSNLASFWAVIGREQYGSGYGMLPRQVWTLIREKVSMTSMTDLVENITFYFKYNVPFYTKYFGWQYGGNLLTVLFIPAGIYGAYRHWRSEHKTFWFWLAVFLITGPVLNTYMNFKLGYSQFDQFPQAMHEVRERDYFFIVSFVFFGVWSGLGLAAIADRLRRAFDVGGEQARLGPPAFAAIAAVVLLPCFVPLAVNYNEADRSGNLIPSQYARNIMNSLDEGGILFTNGDNDTFPLWYIQEVEGVRPDCRVVNLSLLNTNWYIKQMRDHQPGVPISYSDEQIDQMLPMRLPRDIPFKFGEIDLKFPQGSVLYVKDMVLLDIIRTNKWKRPIYFTTTVPGHNRVGLTPFLTMEGGVYRINPRKAVELAQGDPNLQPVPGVPEVFIDVRKTDSLLYNVYSYKTFFREQKGGEEANVRLASHFAAPFAWLGSAYQNQGKLKESIKANQWARKFFESPHQWDFALANLYAQNGQYRESREMLDSFASFSGQPVRPAMYQQLAQFAVNNNDLFEASGFLNDAIALDPDNRNSYVNLFMLYHRADSREEAIQSLQRYLDRFPNDSIVAAELEKYRAGGEFDVQKALSAQP